ncbi:hypothetical protein GH714_016118 [Hevea brasiliensis]|uniref:Uncharacterized protein n=1 Tax=Hevea brasiliensis TaxID=3981 RepID=A0A6A6N195_HEVBR|nr:hypothetical protein GH714_016118 [Hevea brasiliensis]
MAEAILFNIAGGIVSKLASPSLQETKLLWAVQEELDKLRTTVSTIQAVLLDAEKKYSQSHEVKVWVESLKEAFYDADDLLDEFSTDVLLKQMMTSNKMVKEVRLFFSSSNQFAYGLKMARKIKKLRSKLDGIAANKKFLLNELPEKKLPMLEEREQTHSSLPQVVVGREKDKKEIVNFLLSSSCRENVSIISIVGIGGIGKTTLAQLAYNDETVKSNFELKMWVCISENFGVKIIVEKILESLIGEKPKNLEMNTLKDRFHEKINGKKYLLVLDDLWNQDSEKWFHLRDLLVGGGKGSKIIVTTRLKNVAEMIRSEKKHDLQGLLVDDSWSLFANMAFKQGEVISLDHERIGKEIVAKSCPNLTSMPLIPSVRQLVLKNANKKSLEDILKMKILVSQSTSSCYSISPSQLKILEIENIEDLEFLPEELMPNLISLQRLSIRCCPRITKVSSALRHLTFLEILVFVACEELDFSDSEYHSDMPWQHLRRLQVLLFVNLFKLASLPKGLQHVLTLRKLTIHNCPNLFSLPEWMGSLTELQYLWIRECPQLSERCKNKMGADWPKIAHIPNISIDDRWIQ